MSAYLCVLKLLPVKDYLHVVLAINYIQLLQGEILRHKKYGYVGLIPEFVFKGKVTSLEEQFKYKIRMNGFVSDQTLYVFLPTSSGQIGFDYSLSKSSQDALCNLWTIICHQ